ncbi:MAG TPA: phage head-tail connector protein [Phycisphaerae bacterium]|nr:phage head-tail connector protein [Phycisphaerae bacterium]
MSKIVKTFKVDGVATNMTSVKLSNYAATYGVKRNDTDAVVVVDATAMTNIGTGVYEYEFTDPADDLTYTYVLEYVYGGETYWIEGTLTGPTSYSGLATLAATKTHLGVTSTTDNALITSILERVTAQIQQDLGRDIIYTTYTKERYSGHGGARLRLKQWPIVQVNDLRVNTRAALKVTCASATSEAKHAWVRVDSTQIHLELVGGDNAGTDSLTLASYATVTALIAAIDALGKGWNATGEDADAISYPASDLLPTDGKLYAQDETVYLDSGGKPKSAYMVDDADAGILYSAGGFMSGVRNIVVTYVAGYSTIPNDLENACILWAAATYNRAKQGGEGFVSETIGGESQTWSLVPMPAEVRAILDARKVPVV